MQIFKIITFLGNDFSSSFFLLKLLARLEGRRSLKEIEPCLFVDEDEPVHGKNTTLHQNGVSQINFINESTFFIYNHVPSKRLCGFNCKIKMTQIMTEF